MELTNRTAFIVGGTSGIGLGLAVAWPHPLMPSSSAAAVPGR